MKTSKILPFDPLADMPFDPSVAALLKADLHLHQEWSQRLDHVLARRAGRQGHDWWIWASDLMTHTPPGMPRPEQLARLFPASLEADVDLESVVARLEELLVEGAAAGAILIEMRLGGATALLQPEFMALLRDAERRAHQCHPRRLHAERLHSVLVWDELERLERVVAACMCAARDGFSGIDLLHKPYDAASEWHLRYQVAERAAAVGLGSTAHAGEVTTANIAAALGTPGLMPLGHAFYAACDPRLLALVAQRGVAIGCALACSVVHGVVPSHAEHPIRRFVDAGIPVVRCTDIPVQPCTTLGRDYARAAALGLSSADRSTFSANAVRASFISPERKSALLAMLTDGECADVGTGDEGGQPVSYTAHSLRVAIAVSPVVRRMTYLSRCTSSPCESYYA